MAEGRTNVFYESDILTMFDSAGASISGQFKTDVPNNLVAQAELGWSTTPPSALGPQGIKLPKRLKPRHAVGVNTAGKRVRVLIAKLSASLWGNATGTWTYIDNNGATQTATVTGFVGESATV